MKDSTLNYKFCASKGKRESDSGRMSLHFVHSNFSTIFLVVFACIMDSVSSKWAAPNKWTLAHPGNEPSCERLASFAHQSQPHSGHLTGKAEQRPCRQCCDCKHHSHLLLVVSSLALGCQRSLASLVLRHLARAEASVLHTAAFNIFKGSNKTVSFPIVSVNLVDRPWKTESYRIVITSHPFGVLRSLQRRV